MKINFKIIPNQFEPAQNYPHLFQSLLNPHQLNHLIPNTLKFSTSSVRDNGFEYFIAPVWRIAKLVKPQSVLDGKKN